VSPRRIWEAGLAGWAAMAASCGVLAVACAGLSGAYPATSASTVAAGARGAGSGVPHGQAPGHAGAGARPAPAGSQASVPTPTGGSPPGGLAAATDAQSSCREVAHIGDSTSDGLVSPSYLPNHAQRMAAQYADVGVRHTIFDISGARSVVETLPGQVNGYDAARALVREGFRGCWVIALGTDDTADVAVGSAVGRMARIERMMSVAVGEPVLWVGVMTLLDHGPYAEANMQLWNSALQQACARYPNMRIFDWAAVARPHWFISDGTHYTSVGYAARARLIAGALAKAFPGSGQSPGCVVSLMTAGRAPGFRISPGSACRGSDVVAGSVPPAAPHIEHDTPYQQSKQQDTKDQQVDHRDLLSEVPSQYASHAVWPVADSQ
jgi:hypothetical protein